MSAVGPDLPPHLLARRKRKAEEEAQAAKEASTTPPSDARTSKSTSPESDTKRRKIIGPAAPPAPLDERPTEEQEREKTGEESSSDDDEYGPNLPTAADESRTQLPVPSVLDAARARKETAEKPLKRDEWMLVPPKQEDLSARMDPTKLRARGFNTGKGARGPNQKGDDNSMWTETVEQKQKRLADEVMGVAKPAGAGGGDSKPQKTERQRIEDEEKARRIREHNEKYRNKSLYEARQGQSSTSRKEEEDDPTKRAFDYEKDMGKGGKVNHTQRREMVNKAANFSSKFSSGSYL